MYDNKFPLGEYGELIKLAEKIKSPDVQKLGILIIGEFMGCKNMPKTNKELEDVMLHSANLMKVNIVSSTFHAFNPHGLSGVLVLAESHYSIHTWPEHNTIAIDLFCCGDIDYEIGISYLNDFFKAEAIQIFTLPRLISKKII